MRFYERFYQKRMLRQNHTTIYIYRYIIYITSGQGLSALVTFVPAAVYCLHSAASHVTSTQYTSVPRTTAPFAIRFLNSLAGIMQRLPVGHLPSGCAPFGSLGALNFPFVVIVCN